MLILAAFALLLAPDDAAVGVYRAWVAQETVLAKPDFQKITTQDGWQAFWKSHVPNAQNIPRVAFDASMVLVGPSVVPSDVAPAPPPPGDPGVDAWITEKALKIRARLTLRPPEKAPKNAAATRTVLTIVVLPVTPLPIEFQLKAGDFEVAASTHPGGGTVAAAAGSITLKGPLGSGPMGASTFQQAGESYDLHYLPPGFKPGEFVEIVGREPSGVKCIHMCGALFDVETVRRVK